MAPLSASRLGWAVFGFVVVGWVGQHGLWAAGGFSSSLGGTSPQPVWSDFLLRAIYTLTFCGAALIGALIIARHPHHPIGWISSISALMVTVMLTTKVIATAPVLLQAGVPVPLITWVAWGGGLFNVNWALVAPLVLLFPTGALPSARWRPVLWLTGVSAALLLVQVALQPGGSPAAGALENPLGIAALNQELMLLGRVASFGLIAAMLLSACALVLRFRRARGDERQQLRLVVSVAVVWVLSFVVSAYAPSNLSVVVEVVYSVTLGAFVLSFGVAILKYRLYDVDVIISRALVYGALAAGISLVYIVVVAGLGALIGTRGEPNIVLSLVATAVVALAFEPIRERLQRLANRVVYGERATPYAVLAGLSRRIGSALSIDEVLPQLALATTQGIGASRARVRVYVPGGIDRAVAWPPEAVAAEFERVAPVFHQGQPVGEIAVSKQPGEVLTPSERALLEDLAAQAGPAFSNVRLTEELRASRQRIVAAQDAERRRIERDLHDGAQQHLVALSINLRLLQDMLGGDTTSARELLSEMQGQAVDALTTLRDLARGIYPPALADRGVVAALEGHLAKSAQPVSLDVDPATAGARMGLEVEAAVYFCILEALQNCAKHAPAAHVRISLSASPDWLDFAVTDRGPGFDVDRPTGGSGLQGMADRIAAVGGELRIASAADQGSTITARVPRPAPPTSSAVAAGGGAVPARP